MSEPGRSPSSDKQVVLHVRVVTATGGGPDKTILNSPRFLHDSPFELICAFMRPPGDPGFEVLRRRAGELGAEILEVDDHGPFDTGVLKQLAQISRDRGVDIWHAHDYKSNLLGLMVRRRWPMKLVSTVHGWVQRTWKTPLYYALDRYSLKRYDRVICVSDDLAARCLDYGVSTDRCLLIDNGIDVDQYRRQMSKAAARERLGLPAEGCWIGAVGRLSAEKDFSLLIRSVREMLDGGDDIMLAIAGDGDQAERLRRLTERLSLSDRVHLLGFLEDPNLLYQALDIYAVSSLREGLPNSLLESMAFEVPVVATRVAGIGDILESGENGLVVDPGSVEQMTAALAQLVSSPPLRSRLGRNGRNTVDERYSFQGRMAKIQRVYQDLSEQD